jgi:hypothetical protein
MARLLSRLDQLAFADLIEKCQDVAFETDFPANGAFEKHIRRGRPYWYYRGYQRASGDALGSQTLKYVCPASDPDIQRRISAFSALKADYRVRRELASRLRRAGLPAPLAFDGAVLTALAAAGVFRLRAVLVGSAAYQTYSGLVGARLPDALHTTEDMDVAQDYGISVALDDQTAAIAPALQQVDPTFAPFEKWSAPGLAIGFRNDRGFKVEFLNTHQGDRAHGDGASLLPALAIGAQPLEFLDYLIRDPVPSVSLYESGLAVVVPAPARYAVHKVIIASRRVNLAKAPKDIEQAAALIDAFMSNGRHFDLKDAFEEAAERGAAWLSALQAGLARLPEQMAPQTRQILEWIC